MMRFAVAALVALLTSTTALAGNLCAGKKTGTITFYDQEISRDAPLPAPVTQLTFGKPMFALLCLTEKAGPQEANGTKFRVVLYVKAVDLAPGAYNSYKEGKQSGVLRPQLSQGRKDIIVAINEDFGDSLAHLLDPGSYEFRLQAASEKGTGKLDITVDLKNDVAYLQELRKAGYLADGKVKVTVEK